MFERFTEQARQVIVLARAEARLSNHNYIGTEHILLGVLVSASSQSRRLRERALSAKVVCDSFFCLFTEPEGENWMMRQAATADRHTGQPGMVFRVVVRRDLDEHALEALKGVGATYISGHSGPGGASSSIHSCPCGE